MNPTRAILLMLLLVAAPALAQDDGGLPPLDDVDGGFTRDDVVQSCDCATAGGSGWILGALALVAVRPRRPAR